MPAEIKYPAFAKNRGAGYWLRFSNIWASRRKIFRSDNSNEWRYSFNPSEPNPLSRTTHFSKLLGRSTDEGFRFIIIGDSGEGDRSQYALLPLIRALEPDFMIINGDVVYPAGREEDFVAGFFEPYRGLNIPIWAVPGNHEYYSPNHGKEFYEVFCTRKWANRWENYELRLIPQPGTYWELSEQRRFPLVVIGVDSGKAANLDGANNKPADHQQHEWLNWRLGLAQQAGQKVILLFHIPSLTGQNHVEKTHLGQLHHLIHKYDCIRFVTCAHEHNFQYYQPSVFQKYIQVTAAGSGTRADYPHYIVCGGGGASLSNTDFGTGPYKVDKTYPSVAQWKGYTKIGKKIVDKLGLTKNLAGWVIGHIQPDVGSDFDAAGLLSFLLVKATPSSIEVHPVFMDDVRDLFAHLPDGTTVNIQDTNPPVDPMAVQRCLQQPLIL